MMIGKKNRTGCKCCGMIPSSAWKRENASLMLNEEKSKNFLVGSQVVMVVC